MNPLISDMMRRAAADPQRIVLPEGMEERTLKAANRLLSEQVAKLILIGNREAVLAKAQELGLSNIEKATIIDPDNHDKIDTYTELLVELRKSKGMTHEEAAKLVRNPLYLACLMIKSGDADGSLAGAKNTTGDVLRPALQIIKTAPGIHCVSGAFLLFTQAKQHGENGVFVVADCAVTPNPTAQELAEIAVASAFTAEALVNIEPRVAMLSFGTHGSAKGEMVDKVHEATRLAKELAPHHLIDGELQADAALVDTVANLKAPGSPVAGRANVLVFPTLEAGNIGYKLVERLGGAVALGPVLQGIASPVNDLSRGCSSEDIYHMVIITANQAIAAKKARQ